MLYKHLHSRTGGITAIGILCGMLFLLIGAATNESTVSAQNNSGIVETDGQLLNVREGPRSDYVILYQLEDQSAVEILGVDSTGSWYEISPTGESTDESTDTGWAFADYIRQLDDGGSDAEADQSADQTGSTESVDTDIDFASLPIEERAAIVTARLNRAATEVAAIIETATAASEQMAIATVTARAEIAAIEVAKILATADASAQPTLTPESAEAAQPSESDTSDSDASDSDVLDSELSTEDVQSISAATVVARAQIAKTEVARILTTATAEAEVQEEPTPLPTPTPEPTSADDTAESDSAENAGTAATTTERMNIYSGPGTHYTVLATVEADTVFDIAALDSQGRWYQVQTEGMAELAWVYSGLVDATGNLDALPRILETIPTRSPQVTPTQVTMADANVSPTPTVRPLMEASDPATFEIASGQVQVVEFFGFW